MKKEKKVSKRKKKKREENHLRHTTVKLLKINNKENIFSEFEGLREIERSGG